MSWSHCRPRIQGSESDIPLRARIDFGHRDRLEHAVGLREPFDAVLAFNLFHLLRSPAIGLKRLGFALVIPPMRALGLAPYVRRYRFAELEDAIRLAGFDLIETGTFPAMSRFIVARRR
jgi:hypothetical protein